LPPNDIGAGTDRAVAAGQLGVGNPDDLVSKALGRALEITPVRCHDHDHPCPPNDEECGAPVRAGPGSGHIDMCSRWRRDTDATPDPIRHASRDWPGIRHAAIEEG
jgi:hypothetical protein